MIFYRASIAFERGGNTPESFQEYVTNLDTLIVGSQDTGIALAYAVVAAESLGLGTVPIGAVRFKSLDLTKELNLPKYVIPLVGLCVGYPEDESNIKPRLPMKSVYFEEKYDAELSKSGIDEYDETYRKYLAERSTNNRDSNWSQSLCKMLPLTKNFTGNNYELLKQQGYISIDKK